MSTQPLWLVATDLTSYSDGACNEAARIADATGSRLHLLYAQPIEIVMNEFATGEITARQHAAIKKDLDDVRVKLNEAFPKLEITTEVVDGEPAGSILDAAQRAGATHIAVGTHARKGFKHFVLGSVAQNVARRAQIPTLIVRPQGDEK